LDIILKTNLGLSLNKQESIKQLLSQDATLLQNGIIKKDNDQLTLNSKYKIGKVIVKNGIAELILENLQKIFIDLDKLNGAYSDDVVLVQILFNPKRRAKAKVIHIIYKSTQKVLCFIKNKKFYSIKENIELNFDFQISKYISGDVLLVENNRITKLLGNIKDAKTDEKISLYLKNQEYREQEYKTDVSDEFKVNNRVDLTHLPFCTIDPIDAKDHDDAIYFDDKEDTLYVAIADVSAFIKEGTSLDIEAKKRAFSIYLPNKVLPMIPFTLSADLCSLRPNIKRFAFIFKMQLDTKRLVVTGADFFEATIKSQNKYSYEEIDTVIKDKQKGYGQILNLYALTTKLRDKRLKNGFDFRTQELRLKLDEKEELKSVSIETSSPSHQLVEECMLLANCEAAKKLKGLGIFRVHDEPTIQNIEKLIDDIKTFGLKIKSKNNIHQTIKSIQIKASNVNLENEIDELIIQSQQQARYSSKSLGHFGLGFKNYSHFTSPIRRYADLVLHRILKTNKIPKDIDDICLYISDKEREITNLVWDLEARKYARWGSKNINNIFKAIIVDVENGIAKIQAPIIGARVVCTNYKGQKLFSKVTVKLISSDIVSKEIKGKIL
jgi:ribonuclease R